MKFIRYHNAFEVINVVAPRTYRGSTSELDSICGHHHLNLADPSLSALRESAAGKNFLRSPESVVASSLASDKELKGIEARGEPPCTKNKPHRVTHVPHFEGEDDGQSHVYNISTKWFSSQPMDPSPDRLTAVHHQP